MDNPAFSLELETKKGDTQKNGTPASRVHTFNEAITLTEIGKFHYLILLICGLCFMAVTVEIMGVSLLLPLMQCDLESTVSEQGILASAGFLGVILSSHAVGFLADTWGRVRTLRYSLTFGFVATIISGFSVNIWMLIVFRFLNGFCISGCQACVFSLCGEFHGDRSRARYVTMLSIFLTISVLYLPVVAIFILPLRIDAVVLGMTFSSWRVMLLVNSLLSLIAWIGLMNLPETPKYVLVQGNPEAALDILRYMYTKNTGKPATEYPVKSIELQSVGASLNDIRGFKAALKMIWSQTVPLFARERCLQTINLSIIMFVIYFTSHGIFMWFPTMLNEFVARADDGSKICEVIETIQPGNEQASNICSGELDLFVYYLMMIIGAALTLVYVIFTFTIDLIGKKNLLIGWLTLCMICCITIYWTSELVPAFLQFFFVIAVGNCGGIISTISVEFFPTNINAMGMSFMMMIGRLGAVAGSNVIGQTIFDYCDNVFWGLTGILCAIGLMSFLLPAKRN